MIQGASYTKASIWQDCPGLSFEKQGSQLGASFHKHWKQTELFPSLPTQILPLEKKNPLSIIAGLGKRSKLQQKARA